MSTTYRLVCYTCRCSMPGAFASASAWYGFKVWDDKEVREWLGHGHPVGTHEGHDLRIVSDDTDLEWEYDKDDHYIGPRHKSLEAESGKA